MLLILFNFSELLRDRKELKISVDHASPTHHLQVRLRLLPCGSCLGGGSTLSII
jgi:hypothetical protein